MFRLLDIEIRDTSKENIKQDYTLLKSEFVESSKVKSCTSQPHVTVIVGNNGVGKSFILKQIVDIIRVTEKIIKDPMYKSDFKYRQFMLSSFKNDEVTKIEKNGKYSTGGYLAAMPSRLLCISYDLTDKYTYSQNDINSVYKYMGIRSTTNAAFTKAFDNNILKAILEILMRFEENDVQSMLLHESLVKIFEYVGFEPKLRISADSRFSIVFNGKLIESTVNNKLRNIEKKSKDQERSNIDFSHSASDATYITKHTNGKLSSSTEDITRRNLKDGKIGLDIEYNLKSIADCKAFYNDYKVLKSLNLINYISKLNIEFYKFDYFPFENCSSGEKNLFYTFLRLLSEIEKDSLILIDEPETSLHPHWQMKFVFMLKEIFQPFESCHFILATHSHFIVSDLSDESSSIVQVDVVNQNNNICRIGRLVDTMYARKAEDVLLTIFGVATSRNSYIAELVEKTLLSYSARDFRSVADLLCKLNSIKNQLMNDDPLLKIIEKLNYNFGTCGESNE